MPDPAPKPSAPPRRSRALYALLALLGVLSVVGAVSIIALAFGAGAWWNRQPVTRLTAGPATIDQVRALKMLTVLSFEVTSDAEAEHAERKGVWIARGKAEYAVDFSKAVVANASEQSRVVRLRLPPPAVRNAHLDVNRTRLLTYEKTGLGWWTLGALGSRAEFEQKSREMLQRRIELGAGESSLAEAAKGSAVQLLSAIYEAVGWSVQVEWTEGGTGATPSSARP